MNSDLISSLNLDNSTYSDDLWWPNLTKKSRGRRVPTTPGIVLTPDGSARRTRGYTCRVPGYGKCFARGEHLKRHIRSIHTNEKRESSFIGISCASVESDRLFQLTNADILVAARNLADTIICVSICACTGIILPRVMVGTHSCED